MDISGLKRQHSEIRDEMNKLKSFISNDVVSNSFEMAKEISFMAGKLKIHLQSEDKYLYPKLLQSNNLKLRDLAKSYISEMSNVSSEFELYKNKYNTKSKIIDNSTEIINETKKVLGLLEKRLDKEDRELYPLV
ncbi:hemerythrin domain-containing protein [Clostridium sp. JN-9]|uniref:hemerythrin domain-containing protein n=1 Tax=Clostridium sp. JN-9 TaxID=2507159 RepID=UPI000FFE17E8|nr:hemerythrin domain-containing protein [Clostridium sp. JN-9]QAT41285.1 hemerythrin domain-containing protein [Clostridium sp. JN-9]